MPRLIDHAERRQELAEAVWRVILREGPGRVSVRSVAAEAGMSAGSLRHVFPSQAELMHFSMQFVLTRVKARIYALPNDLDPHSRATRIALELLPLDEERRAEMEVNLAFVVHASTDPALRPVRDESHAAVRYACDRMLFLLSTAGELDPALDVELEIGRLHALMDGLAFQLTYRSTEADATQAVAVLQRHLESVRPRA